ncbi:MAG: NUDIX hydrolase [uncultured bacterium]|nr:MAG: NUDIX hydrolase [uncultured bacterium]
MKYISFEKSIGGVVYRQQENKILYLLLRYRSGQWDFPKGHVEKGETEHQTLKREIMEETGIADLKILKGFRQSVRYFYTAKGNEKKERIEKGRGIYIFKKAVFFATETRIEKVIIDYENKDFAWLSFEDAMKRLGNDDSRGILTSAQKAISK